MPMNKIILFCFLFLWIGLHPIAAISLEKQSTVRQKIRQAIQGKNATVGVAFSIDGQLFTFNDEHRYPLMSVFKLHVAIAALQKMENECIALDSLRFIESSQIHKDTYSPLRELYPERNFYLSYADLMRYAVSQSDNNACDILIDYLGGIDIVKDRIDKLGITNYNLTETEETMHSRISNCYNNWSTPSSTLQLLEKLYNEPILNETHTEFLKNILIETSTGKDKIKAGLPDNIALGHKTGSSDRLDDGTKIGDNDTGVIYLPNGKLCFLAISSKTLVRATKPMHKLSPISQESFTIPRFKNKKHETLFYIHHSTLSFNYRLFREIRFCYRRG